MWLHVVWAYGNLTFWALIHCKGERSSTGDTTGGVGVPFCPREVQEAKKPIAGCTRARGAVVTQNSTEHHLLHQKR